MHKGKGNENINIIITFLWPSFNALIPPMYCTFYNFNNSSSNRSAVLESDSYATSSGKNTLIYFKNRSKNNFTTSALRRIFICFTSTLRSIVRSLVRIEKIQFKKTHGRYDIPARVHVREVRSVKSYFDFWSLQSFHRNHLIIAYGSNTEPIPYTSRKVLIAPRTTVIRPFYRTPTVLEKPKTTVISNLKMGVAAESASRTGVMGVSWSYSQRASFTFVAWKVTWNGKMALKSVEGGRRLLECIYVFQMYENGETPKHKIEFIIDSTLISKIVIVSTIPVPSTYLAATRALSLPKLRPFLSPLSNPSRLERALSICARETRVGHP